MFSKNNNDKPDEQPDGSSKKRVHFNENTAKKEKKKIKFQIPLVDEIDETTTKPSTSGESLVEVDQQDTIISDKKFHVSFLKKFLNPTLKEVSPRSVVFKPCNRDSLFETSNALLSAASYQFFDSDNLTIDDFNGNLIRAACLGQVRAAKKAIRKGADVNTVKDRQTPLGIAVETGNTRFVTYLLRVPGIEINLKNSLGQTPLIVAVGNGFDSIVRLLLKYDADVNLQDNMGKTALHVALFQQRTHLIKLLLAFGANYNIPDVFGEKPMYTATVKKPNLKCLKMLLKVGALPNYFTWSGLPLLSRSIINGAKFTVIEELVKNGASVNAQDIISQKTPLHYTALINNLQVAEFLINEGADVNLKTIYNYTPLDEAKLHRSSEVKRFLMEFCETETQNKTQNQTKKKSKKI